MSWTNREFDDMNSSFNDPYHTPLTGAGNWAKTLREQGSARPSPRHEPSSPPKPSQPGIVDEFFEIAARLTYTFPPLKACLKLGERIISVGWKVRAILALGGVLAAVILTHGDPAHQAAWPAGAHLLDRMAGEYGFLLGLGLGALAGWMLPLVVGCLLVICAVIGGCVLALVLMILFFGMIYLVVAAVAGWPPFDP
jgi:hypothetical protein